MKLFKHILNIYIPNAKTEKNRVRSSGELEDHEKTQFGSKQVPPSLQFNNKVQGNSLQVAQCLQIVAFHKAS